MLQKHQQQESQQIFKIGIIKNQFVIFQKTKKKKPHYTCTYHQLSTHSSKLIRPWESKFPSLPRIGQAQPVIPEPAHLPEKDLHASILLAAITGVYAQQAGLTTCWEFRSSS